MWRILSIMITSLLFISASSFSLKSRLSELLVQHYSPAQLALAVKLKLPEALKIKLNNETVGSARWLKTALTIAPNDGQAAYQLATYYQGIGYHQQYDFWLNAALKLHSEPAFLAKIAQLQQRYQYQQAWQLMQEYQAFFQSQQVTKIAINLAVATGNIAYLKIHQDKLTELGMLTPLQAYGILAKPSVEITAKCDNSVQFLASRLSDLDRSKMLIKKINQHKIGQYFCFNTPQYINPKQLKCKTQPNKAIQCDEAQLQNIAVTARYLIIMLPQGGANVHYGIMYLDAQDSVMVLQHELLHFLGFVDEYPLAADHPFCTQQNSAINVITLPLDASSFNREQLLAYLPWQQEINESTPLMVKAGSSEYLGTPNTKGISNKFGLFPAKTCNANLKLANNHFRSYRAIQNNGALLHFENPIPEAYFRLINKYQFKFKMPSFDYNLALVSKGNAQKRFLSIAQSKEKTTQRRSKVLSMVY